MRPFQLAGFVFLAAIGLFAQAAPAEVSIYIDDNGIMRWTSSGKEIALLGVNYAVPFAHGYRAIGYVGANHETTIDRDVYHFARMGLDAYRIHIWDIEISNKQGDLVENDHLRLLDYLIMRLKERGIKIVLTTMRNSDNAFPEGNDVLGWGFSRYYPKYGNVAHHTPEGVQAQQRYVKGLLVHVNQYTKLSYKDDPDILAFEINNEPSHTNNVQEVKDYLNQMTTAMREAGLKKPIFYNMSHNFGVTDAFLTSDIQGGTFQWYPTGLNAGFTQKGNFLPNVDSYPIPFADRPAFKNKGKLIYEFDAADVSDSYLYPAMARTFRGRGFQFMTQFAYDSLALAYENSEYKTHHLNLAFTPSKGISLKIASEVAHRVPLNKSYGAYPRNTEFEGFRVSYEENLSEMITDEAFYYSNNTKRSPAHSDKLEHVAGVGSSSVVQYEGTGAYFLDKLDAGVWRLEVMPDAFLVRDPFADPNIDKVVSRIVWNRWPMAVSLPDLGSGFALRGINDGNFFRGAADGQVVMVQPGAYILTRKGASSDRWTGNEKYGNITVKEFVAPAAIGGNSYDVLHSPLVEVTAGKPLTIGAEIVGPVVPDEVELRFRASATGELRPTPSMSGYNPERLPMRRTKGYHYEAVIPASKLSAGGGIMYHIVLRNGNRRTTFPGDFNGAPGEWNYYNQAYWASRVAAPGAPLQLLAVEDDFNYAQPLSPSGGGAQKSLVAGSAVGSHAIRIRGALRKGDLHLLREFIGQKIAGRKGDLAGFSDVVIRARALNRETKALQFGLLTSDGYTYAAPFGLSDEWQTIRIPLSRLQQTGTVLRLSYPRMGDTFFTPTVNIPFDAGKIENWEISTASVFDAGQLGYDVENIWLEAR